MPSRRTSPRHGTQSSQIRSAQLASASVTSAVGMGETFGRLRARRNSIFTQTVIWITVLICLAFLLGALAQAWSNSQLDQQVQAAQQQLQQVQAHHDALAKLAQHYNDPSVVESEARQQLGMSKPGEHVVVIVNAGSTNTSTAKTSTKVAPTQGFWQAWWQAFFRN